MSTIITFTTDWNNSDYYTGTVKASIISKFRDVVFVNISHNIEHFSIFQAAFILKNTFEKFPADTIHIIGVDSEPDFDGKILIAKYKSQYFIGSNNGCTGFIFKDKPEIAVLIESGFAFNGSTFTELNLFADIAAYIAKGGDILDLGDQIEDVKRKSGLNCQIEPDIINGTVIYIDSYQNAITNITKDIFDEYVAGSNYEILINTNRLKINTICQSYKQVENGHIVCIFNSLGLLEIAIREGKAAQLLNLNRKSAIRIRYKL